MKPGNTDCADLAHPDLQSKINFLIAEKAGGLSLLVFPTLFVHATGYRLLYVVLTPQLLTN